MIKMFRAEKTSGVLPPYEGEKEVNAGNVNNYIQVSGNGCSFSPPEWLSGLVMVQANIAKTTLDGNFAAAVPLLEHLADIGANALWVTPFFENEGNPNRTSHYGNQGPQTLARDCFAGKTFEERAAELQNFIREAHKRNIYVFADVVTYGVLESSPIFQAYRNGTEFEGMDVSGWFTGTTLYSGYRFCWESESLRRWFTDRMADLILRYGFDGFRVDSEPHFFWYDSDGDGVEDCYADIFSEVRLRVAGYIRDADGRLCYPASAKGRKIAVFSEKNNLRNYGYDFEQYGVIHYGDETTVSFQISHDTHPNWFAETDLAQSVREGRLADGRWFTDHLHTPADTVNRFRYYSYCVSNHDYHSTAVNKQLWVLGYQAIMAPFLPIWYYGEECGLESLENKWLNAVRVDVDALLQKPENAAFLKQVKRLIFLRRTYPDLFGMPEQDIRQSNVAHIGVIEGALGYARPAKSRLALVLANPGNENMLCDVTFDPSLLPQGAEPDFADLLSENVPHFRAEICPEGYHICKIPIAPGGMAVLIAGETNGI